MSLTSIQKKLNARKSVKPKMKIDLFIKNTERKESEDVYRAYRKEKAIESNRVRRGQGVRKSRAISVIPRTRP